MTLPKVENKAVWTVPTWNFAIVAKEGGKSIQVGSHGVRVEDMREFIDALESAYHWVKYGTLD